VHLMLESKTQVQRSKKPPKERQLIRCLARTSLPSRRKPAAPKEVDRGRAHFLPVDLLAMRIGERNGPLCTSFHGAALHQKNRVVGGVKRFGKPLQVSIWHLRSLLGPQPDKDLRKRAASQFEDLLDRNLVCLQQVNCGHERIIVRLQR
jgi:hypothetical protein